jgi:hypothetical protein
MQAKIVWESSGDEVKFIPTFPNLLEYYIDQLKSNNVNAFRLQQSKFDSKLVLELETNITSISKLADKIPFEISNWNGNVIDQLYLNQLHREWVFTGQKYPQLPRLLRLMNGKDQDFRNINDNLHKVESSFCYEFTNYKIDPFQIDNKFGTEIIGFDKPNLVLGFDNLGRSSWDKFLNWDDADEQRDTNNYQKLSGLIQINLNRPLTFQPPVEYLDWCRARNIEPVGFNISLGNIVNLQNKLTDIRKIFIRNATRQSNQFFFEISPR